MSDEARNAPGTPQSPAAGTLIEDPPHADPYTPPPSAYALESAPAAVSTAEDWDELSGCFFEIWTRPRETIRRIVEVNPKYWVVTLAALGGSTGTISPWPGGRGGMSLLAVLLVGATIGPLMAIATLWIGASIVRGLGHKFLGGVADPLEMRAALAWANVPTVAMLPVALIAAVLVGPGPHSPGDMPLIAYPLLALGVVAGGWSLFIASQNVAEVQGYRSGWMGFWNLVLPGAIVFGVVAVIGVLVAVTMGLR